MQWWVPTGSAGLLRFGYFLNSYPKRATPMEDEQRVVFPVAPNFVHSFPYSTKQLTFRGEVTLDRLPVL